MIKSCYIHIPFCNKICSYCDFPKIYNIKKFKNKYLDSLEKEIDSIYKGETLDTIYVGGGTPSCLDIDELERLFNIIKKLKVSDKLEYTIEGNFESTTKEKLDLYKEYGINRLSFGLESTNKDILLFMDRELNKEEVINKINYCKEIGIDNINIDLIYAIPNETIDILKKDIDFIKELDIKHISTYSLIIEPHTKLSINKTQSIDVDVDTKMYEYICRKLKSLGFNHYEISNFAKPGYESKHNTCYWDNKRYYGFGLGASSYIDNRRITNTRSINKYIDGNFRLDEEIVNTHDEIEYEILLNLRKNTGINLFDFKKKFHKNLIDLYDYNYLLDKGYIVLKDDNLFIPEAKWYVSNEIIVELLEGEK